MIGKPFHHWHFDITGICSGSQCDSIQSELVSLRLENSTSGENIEVDNLNGNFTLKVTNQISTQENNKCSKSY